MNASRHAIQHRCYLRRIIDTLELETYAVTIVLEYTYRAENKKILFQRVFNLPALPTNLVIGCS